MKRAKDALTDKSLGRLGRGENCRTFLKGLKFTPFRKEPMGSAAHPERNGNN